MKRVCPRIRRFGQVNSETAREASALLDQKFRWLRCCKFRSTRRSLVTWREVAQEAQRGSPARRDHRLRLELEALARMPAPEVTKLVSKHVPAIAGAVSCWRGSRVSTSNDCGECVPCWCGELPWKQTY